MQGLERRKKASRAAGRKLAVRGRSAGVYIEAVSARLSVEVPPPVILDWTGRMFLDKGERERVKQEAERASKQLSIAI